MSSYTLNSYPVEVLSWMRNKEQEHPTYQGNSPQISMRNSLVNFMRKVCEARKLSLLTTHLAVNLLDRFMDSHDISENQLKLTAIISILLAAKLEENDSSIPTMPALNYYVNHKYSITLLNSMENFVLKFFDWGIVAVTAAHFAEFFLTYAISSTDTVNGESLSCPQVIVRKLWDYTQVYLDISLQDLKYLHWRSSRIAASCVACARLQMNFSPTWTSTLQLATGYSFKELTDTIEHLSCGLLESEDHGSLCNTPDSGYHSDTRKRSSAKRKKERN